MSGCLELNILLYLKRHSVRFGPNLLGVHCSSPSTFFLNGVIAMNNINTTLNRQDSREEEKSRNVEVDSDVTELSFEALETLSGGLPPRCPWCRPY